ncbi:MAG: TetR/AcrR family transcriptional regulator [Chthoniobacterales bacterium]
MRYDKDHKKAIRRKILELAAARFRKEGLNNVGVASLMGDAGLTHGGFYSYFSSKETLIKETLESSMNERFIGALLVIKKGGIDAFIHYYLCPEHRDHPEKGCPIAALAQEIGGHSIPIRKAYAKKVQGMLAFIDSALPQPDPAKALAILATLVGAMQLARAVPDAKLSKQILAAAARTACDIAHF